MRHHPGVLEQDWPEFVELWEAWSRGRVHGIDLPALIAEGQAFSVPIRYPALGRWFGPTFRRALERPLSLRGGRLYFVPPGGQERPSAPQMPEAELWMPIAPASGFDVGLPVPLAPRDLLVLAPGEDLTLINATDTACLLFTWSLEDAERSGGSDP